MPVTQLLGTQTKGERRGRGPNGSEWMGPRDKLLKVSEKPGPDLAAVGSVASWGYVGVGLYAVSPWRPPIGAYSRGESRTPR